MGSLKTVGGVRTLCLTGGESARTVQALVLRSLCCFLATDWFGIERNKTVSMPLFLLAQIGNHCAKIETEPFGIGMPDSADFINNWVVLHDYSSIPTIGGSIPDARQSPRHAMDVPSGS